MDKKITRKEAIKKAGMSALVASSLVLLNTKANACDSVTTGTDNSDNGHKHRRRHRHR